jgi:hypothetical protein
MGIPLSRELSMIALGTRQQGLSAPARGMITFQTHDAHSTTAMDVMMARVGTFETPVLADGIVGRRIGNNIPFAISGLIVGAGTADPVGKYARVAVYLVDEMSALPDSAPNAYRRKLVAALTCKAGRHDAAAFAQIALGPLYDATKKYRHVAEITTTLYGIEGEVCGSADTANNRAICEFRIKDVLGAVGVEYNASLHDNTGATTNAAGGVMVLDRGY